ncbi:hypothetical protein BU23DRAFT_94639 [Bimuria novae-zelandiae CBS 107.79]|uniref:J domain-containing protein n=1 Tax=Bimuria novae-zelandiae CBS 107.79 TaxID=1447943 RepID=A0A6A5VHI6_9PLEO|nr:hypothetical protein BU23DRAFT_94639 [Bimuria novae-zelandiae CBS 107.79]
MATETHYTTLGVTKAAEQSVIRAAYKVLVLNHHPDKIVHLSAEARAEHSAIFCRIQAAYDVLGNPNMKAAYDCELERHGNRVDIQRSTFHRPSTPASAPRKRHTTIHLTSPEEKRALKAKVEQDLAYLREQRAKRDIEDAGMDVAGLKFMLQIWTEMAAKYDGDVESYGYLRAYCAVQIQAYQAKIERRECEHVIWLQDMSRPKTPGAKHGKPAVARPATMNSYRTRVATPAKAVPRAAPSQSAAAVSPAASRADEKTRKESARQQIDAKAAAVRAEKEKKKARAEKQARRESEHVARVRAKAGAPPLGKWGAGGNAYADDTPPTPREKYGEDSITARPNVKRACSKCGVEHASIVEWRKCAK